MKPTKRKTESTNNSKSKKTEIDYSRQTKQQLSSILEGVCLELENAEDEIKAKDIKIDILEQKIESVHIRSKSSKSVSVQTEDMEGMFCIECEYPAEDIFDLGEHMYEIHAEDTDEYSESCYYCSQVFKTKSDVMLHSKRTHKEKVKPCQNYLNGHCDYTDIDCWFSHTKSVDVVKRNFKCNYCEENFNIKTDFMVHKKKHHAENVPKCREELNCHYGAKKCWFLHTLPRNENKNGNDNQEYLEKLFDMVEKFVDRLIKVESKMNG